MKLESVKTKEKKRVGRGISSGQGKTAGRGTKGQKSRSGFNIPNRHEGGQTPLSMRLPKLPGFKSLRKKATIVSLDQISANFKKGEIVTLDALEAKGIIGRGEKAKILNNGKLSVKVSLGSDVRVSENIASLFSSDLPAIKEDIAPIKADKTPEVKKDKAPVKKEKVATKKVSAKKAVSEEITK